MNLQPTVEHVLINARIEQVLLFVLETDREGRHRSNLSSENIPVLLAQDRWLPKMKTHKSVSTVVSGLWPKAISNSSSLKKAIMDRARQIVEGVTSPLFFQPSVSSCFMAWARDSLFPSNSWSAKSRGKPVSMYRRPKAGGLPVKDARTLSMLKI